MAQGKDITGQRSQADADTGPVPGDRLGHRALLLVAPAERGPGPAQQDLYADGRRRRDRPCRCGRRVKRRPIFAAMAPSTRRTARSGSRGCAGGRTGAGDAGRLQNELFDLGADLATPDGIEGALRLRRPGRPARTRDRRDECDLAPLTSFVLPGGTAIAALPPRAHRRAPRRAGGGGGGGGLQSARAPDLNRLSDHFVRACAFGRA